MEKGFSGNIAGAFIQSKLTLLLMIAFLLIGGYSTLLIPREEEPQIEVPIADVMIAFPGAGVQEVESRIVAPLEKIVSNVKGVEYVYSTSMQGQAMLIVQFYVGEDIERSLVKLYNEIMKHMDQMPQGVSLPLIKTRAIDDVPVLGLTLWSNKYDDFTLRKIGESMTHEIKKINDVATVNILGGRSREVQVMLDKDRMTESGLDFLKIAQQMQGSNVQLQNGYLVKSDTSFSVQTGNFLTTADDVANLVVGIQSGQPVYLRQIAKVTDGPQAPSRYVFFGHGSADTAASAHFSGDYPAVTLSIGKRKGADAM
jgi:multidrug efflux pump subunit AcrB